MEHILPNVLFGKEFDLTGKELAIVTKKLLSILELALPNYKKIEETRKKILFIIRERYVYQNTLAQIGKKIERSRERTWQLEQTGLSILRKQKLTKEIYKKYLEGKEK